MKSPKDSAAPGSTRAARRDRLRQQLLDMINRSDEGGRLPSERELSGSLGVARETLRRALIHLEREGVLKRKQGSGTYVSGQPWTKRFQLISFSEDMRQRGLVPSSRLLSAEHVAASGKLAQKLRVVPGAWLIRIQRLRLADGAPMAIETAHLVKDFLPGLELARLADVSLYAEMESAYGIRLRSARQEIHATVTDEQEAALLEVAPFSPALLVIRQVSDEQGRLVEYGKSLYRADRYRFETNVYRPASTGKRRRA
jgi:GntR family transcriptional regulator